MAIKTMTAASVGSEMWKEGWHEMVISEAKAGKWNDKDIIDLSFKDRDGLNVRIFAAYNKETNEEFSIANLFKYANAGIVGVLEDPTGKNPVIQYDDDPKNLVDKAVNVYLFKVGKYSQAGNNLAPVVQEGEHLSYNEKDVEAIKKSCMRGIQMQIDRAKLKADSKATTATSATSTEDIPF